MSDSSGINIYLQLFSCALVPVFLSGLMYTLKRNTAFSRLSQLTQQLISGILFGLAAILGTEYGVDVGGATANARDAAPLCAGLLFGAPAGIVAGIIGGVHRWFAVAWGAGMYSRVACSLSTIIAGFYAAFLRRHIFEDKRPALSLAFMTGGVMEIIHMVVLFLTHIPDAERSLQIVQICTAPMVLCNGISVMLSVLVVNIYSANLHQDNIRSKTISQRFQSPMLVLVVVAYFLSTSFVYMLQTFSAQNTADENLQLNINDMKQEVLDTSDRHMLIVARSIAADLEENPDLSLHTLAHKHGVTDIWVVDQNGIVVNATDDNIGFDMSLDKYLPEEEQQSNRFLVLLTDECDEYVQAFGPLASNHNVFRKLAGVSLSGGGFVQIGYNAEDMRAELDERVINISANRHIGKTGHIILVDENKKIVSDVTGTSGKAFEELGFSLDESTPINEAFKADINGIPCRCIVDISEGYYILAVLPESEIYETRSSMFLVNSFMEILVFAALFIEVFLIIRRVLIKDLRNINAGLEKITSGELETKITAYSNDELSALSDGINSTVDTLKQYIAEAEGRIDRELAFAKNIQHAALPSVFPPYPDRTDFDIFAAMDTAKEVGGDFYDFYLIDENHIAVLMADVSGKGIPAAMFMMTAKTMIKSLAETGIPVEEVFTRANRKLCDHNDAGMFVTAWMGVIDIRTGHVDFANAGHNPPLIYRNGGGYEYFKSKPGLVLAGMDGITYKRQEFTLYPGDKLFLYTDGVTEAINPEQELFGEERLKKLLNMCAQLNAEDTVRAIKAEVMLYAGPLEQFDDITILQFDYFGNGDDNMEYRDFPANDDSLSAAQDFISEGLENAGASMKVIMQVSVAFEEMFVNVAHYAYPDNPGDAIIGFGMDGNDAVIVIKDSGVPFNPFEHSDPDVSLPAEERGIGGLGIFMTRKIMDKLDYEYRDGHNIVTMRKTI